MGLVTPKLDDRQFQEIVDEAKSRIPHFCKEWTDHNVSDPGITLIELFAWMTDLLLYRLNQVPDLHYIKFLELLGIKLRETVPAKVPVTFWLSAPQPNPVLIPTGTEVASTQTETERSIVFSTDGGCSRLNWLKFWLVYLPPKAERSAIVSLIYVALKLDLKASMSLQKSQRWMTPYILDFPTI